MRDIFSLSVNELESLRKKKFLIIFELNQLDILEK